MSELINRNDNRATIRWKLLTGASALALTGYISSATLAKAEDSHPVLWLDLGGQFDSLTDSSETWVPGNLPPVIDHPVAPSANQTPRIGYDMDGKIVFQPTGSDWNFSVAIKYGKAKKGPKHAHDQTYKTRKGLNKYYHTTYAFTDLNAVEETKHLVLDFQAGKDVGLGLFGGHGSSTVNFGVRVAQFNEKANSLMTAVTNAPGKYSHADSLDASMEASRSFSGVGPSVGWSGSVPIAGSLQDGLSIDWGANAALLFGRQKAKSRTHTDHRYYTGGLVTYHTPSGALGGYYVTATRTNVPHTFIRNKSVTVPNLGGMIGMSFRKGNAKVSFGYRADFFFNAIDGGIATRKTENRGFYGPFASISIGIDD